MKFFVVSGMQNTGKTTVLNQIGEWLTTVKGYAITSGITTATLFKITSSGKYDDISLVLEKDNKKIILHSATDDIARIKELKDVITKIQMLIL